MFPPTLPAHGVWRHPELFTFGNVNGNHKLWKVRSESGGKYKQQDFVWLWQSFPFLTMQLVTVSCHSLLLWKFDLPLSWCRGDATGFNHWVGNRFPQLQRAAVGARCTAQTELIFNWQLGGGGINLGDKKRVPQNDCYLHRSTPTYICKLKKFQPLKKKWEWWYFYTKLEQKAGRTLLLFGAWIKKVSYWASIEDTVCPRFKTTFLAVRVI